MSDQLKDMVREALQRPVPPEARDLAAALAAEHGTSVLAVLFYGSCLRDQTAEGVLDFYVLVDSYKDFHTSRVGAVANALLPPTVTYRHGEDARAKIAIISAKGFAEKMRPSSRDTTMWARFCQPAALLYARDSDAAGTACEAVADAIATAAVWARRLGPEKETSDDIWTGLFRSTYGAELRVEHGGDRGKTIYLQAAAYFDSVLEPALERARQKPDRRLWSVEAPGGAIGSYKRQWRRRSLLGKVLNIMRLAKAAFTFDQKVEYIEWKVERHSGKPLELSDFQRRHPLIAAPGVLWKLWRQGAIR